MNKILLKGFATIALFFGLFFALQQIDWMGLFKVEEAKLSTETKLGELFWEMIAESEEEIYDEEILNPIDSIITKICESNDIDQTNIKWHVMQQDEVNAFVIPDDYMIIYTGLIQASQNESELAGVLAHEIAHMELNHVMSKLAKEIGLAALIGITTGGSGGGELIGEVIRTLSSSAFDRNHEKEADLKGVDYLLKAGINPEGFANFLYRIGSEQGDALAIEAWLSTHPNSIERGEYIISYSADKIETIEAVLDTSTWQNLQMVVNQ